MAGRVIGRGGAEPFAGGAGAGRARFDMAGPDDRDGAASGFVTIVAGGRVSFGASALDVDAIAAGEAMGAGSDASCSSKRRYAKSASNATTATINTVNTIPRLEPGFFATIVISCEIRTTLASAC